MTKKCYIYQVPKYLSKEIAFTVCMCVCVPLCTLQFCPQAQSIYCATRKNQKRRTRVKWTGIDSVTSIK